jgi:nitrate/TMAO reductase-like tetraheme cytochrome c subunit
VSVVSSPLAVVEIACAALAASILIAYVVFRPPLVHATKLWLLFGLGVFPVGAAFSGNVQGFEATKKREFCGSCHVMAPHREDSDDRTSGSLASRHARNAMFGSENCYACHANYGMFGTIVTKAGGLRHVWLYLTEYRNTSIEEAKKSIRLRAPAEMNENCKHCHSTEDTLWLKVPDHKALLKDVRTGRIGCASEGCHGLAHPFFRPPVESENR